MKLITLNDVCGKREPGRHDAADHELCRKALAVLNQHYNAYIWVVGCNSGQGIMTIGIPELCQWQYVIHLKKLWSDPGMTLVVRGAGEFLERYNIPRSNLCMDAYYQALHENPIGYRLGPPQ